MSEQLSPGVFVMAIICTILFAISTVGYLSAYGFTFIISDLMVIAVLTGGMAGFLWLFFYALIRMPWSGYN